ncbi:MAG: ArsR/SmtB family transcription factor [Ignavibacteria bacterium]
MAIHKRDKFPDNLNEIAALLKVMSHPARLEIIRVLSNSRRCICKDLVRVLPLSQATVSQHLRELEKHKLIKRENVGTKSVFSLNYNMMLKMNKLFSSYHRKIFGNYRKRAIKICDYIKKQRGGL